MDHKTPGGGDGGGGGGGLRIQIVSDVHLEFYDGGAPDLLEILTPSAPVLALLGDMHTPADPLKEANYRKFLLQCCEHFDRVLVLMGNHEFWTPSRDKFGKDIRKSAEDIREVMRRLCSSHEKLTFLDDSALTINGVRVIGSVLWSAVPATQTVEGAQKAGGNPTDTVEYRMNDYRKVFVRGEPLPSSSSSSSNPSTTASASSDSSSPKTKEGGQQEEKGEDNGEEKNEEAATKQEGATKQGEEEERKFQLLELQVSHTNAWHEASVRFIEEELQKASAAGMNALVLTHHAPTLWGTNDPKYPVAEQGITTAFGTNLEYLMSARAPVKSKAKLPQRKPLTAVIEEGKPSPFASLHTWAFGHTHWCCDMKLGGVRVFANQRGYKHEVSPGYRKDLVIHVPSDWVAPPTVGSKCVVS